MSSIRTCIYYSRKKKVERGKNRNKIIKIKLYKLDNGYGCAERYDFY